MSSKDRLIGKISYYNEARGFGFVFSAEPGLARTFFHASSVNTGEPRTNRLVTFEQSMSEKGPIAINVEVFGDGGVK